MKPECERSVDSSELREGKKEKEKHVCIIKMTRTKEGNDGYLFWNRALSIWGCLM